jgi:hypothetical protein
MKLKKLIIDNIASIEHAEIDFDAIARAEDAKTKWNMKHMNVNSLFGD